jgi:hypothetical protein
VLRQKRNTDKQQVIRKAGNPGLFFILPGARVEKAFFEGKIMNGFTSQRGDLP